MLREFVSSGKMRVYSEQRISKSVLMMKGNFKKSKSKAKNISFLITIWNDNGDETRKVLRCCHAYHKSANTCSKRMSSIVSLCDTPLQVSIKTKHIWIAAVLEPFRRRFAAEMSDVHCSFRPLVGGVCTFARRDKAKSTEIVPLLTCEKDISRHISSLAFADVENEVDLLLARSAIFTRPKNIGEFTICPSHRSNLGVGWYRGSTKCRVPEVIARHRSKQKPKAERGIGKRFSRVILRKTGAFIAVGSGLCSSSPILTILKATRKQVLTSFTHLHCSQGICRDCRMMLSEDKPPHSPEATDKEQDHPIGSSAGEMALVSQFEQQLKSKIIGCYWEIWTSKLNYSIEYYLSYLFFVCRLSLVRLFISYIYNYTYIWAYLLMRFLLLLPICSTLLPDWPDQVLSKYTNVLE